MAVEVKVPAVGESVEEAMIHKWHKTEGDYAELDDVLCEIETDKATVEVTAETEGALHILKKEGETVAVGDTVATLDPDAKKPAGGGGSPAAAEASKQQPAAQEKPAAAAKPAPAAQPAPAASGTGGEAPLSPAVKRLVDEHQLDPSRIPATGKGGRLTKGDVLEFMENGGGASGGGAAAAAPRPQPAPEPEDDKGPPRPATGGGERRERREPMSMLRRRIAQRLVQAQQTAAMLTTFNEIDMSGVMELRKEYKEPFKEKHEVSLGFMSFFVKASIEALKQFPAINGWVEGGEIVYHDYYDIGVAVSSDKGLVVPVIRDADKLGFADVEKSVGYYGKKARDGKITVDELTGGTFTISNGGVFGSLLSTPILNPPQSAILGMHKIEERPVAVNGQVVVRPMMYVALSYDHRIVDGKEAVQFLVKIKECVEDPRRLLLGV